MEAHHGLERAGLDVSWSLKANHVRDFDGVHHPVLVGTCASLMKSPDLVAGQSLQDQAILCRYPNLRAPTCLILSRPYPCFSKSSLTSFE